MYFKQQYGPNSELQRAKLQEKLRNLNLSSSVSLSSLIIILTDDLKKVIGKPESLQSRPYKIPGWLHQGSLDSDGGFNTYRRSGEKQPEKLEKDRRRPSRSH